MEDDRIDVKFSSDFNLTTKTVIRTPQTVYTDNVTVPNTQLLGQIDDPICGKSTAQIYTQFDFSTRKNNPFDSVTIDSVHLIMLYDTFGIYGTIEEEVTIRVFEIEEELIEEETYQSDHVFMTSTMPIAEKRFTPAPFDSVIIQPNEKDTLGRTLTPRVFINIDPNYVIDKIQPLDSAFWSSPDSFRMKVNGLKLEMEASNTMLGFRLDRIDASQLKVYYTTNDTLMECKEFNFLLDDVIVKTAYYEHDYSGSLAGNILNDSLNGMSDSLIFLQEMQGLSPKVGITGLSKLSGTLINEAVLEYTVASPPGDDAALYPPVSILTLQQQGDSSIIDIRDTELAKRLAGQGGSTSFYTNAFGGNIQEREVNGDTIKYYQTVLTSHLQKIVDEGGDSTEVLISSFLRPESPRRVVFYGDNSENPVQLRITYTELD